jgi:hypothetical protein
MKDPTSTFPAIKQQRHLRGEGPHLNTSKRNSITCKLALQIDFFASISSITFSNFRSKTCASHQQEESLELQNLQQSLKFELAQPTSTQLDLT